MEELRQYNKDYRNRQKAIGDVNENGVNMMPGNLIGQIIVTSQKIGDMISRAGFSFLDIIRHRFFYYRYYRHFNKLASIRSTDRAFLRRLFTGMYIATDRTSPFFHYFPLAIETS